MKRNLFLALCIAVHLPGTAQTDVSDYYLENSGFDTQFTYDQNRTGNVSGDVINDIYGWTNETTATYTVAGTFAYNPGVTFNGSSALPASGYNGSTGGALGLTTGWGMQLVYTQTVTLPAGTYHLNSAYYNVGTVTAGRSLLAWVPNSGAEVTSSVSAFPLKTWTTDEVSFTLTAQTTGKIRIGFASVEGASSVNSAKILVDYVKLMCDAVDKTALKNALTVANRTYGDGSGIYAAELKAVIDEAQAVYDSEDASVLDVVSLTSKLTEATNTFRYKNASESKPLAMTSYIVNPSFENGGTAGWENDGFNTQTNSYFTGKNGTTYLERWVVKGSCIPDVSISQQITGLPNGKYRLRAAVANIQQNGDNSTVNKGDPQTGVTLFADRYEEAVNTMKSGLYVYFTVVDGQVTIGMRAENATGNWVCLDNFILQYLGENTPQDYADYMVHYAGYIRNLLQAGQVQADVRKEADAALSTAESLTAADLPDETALAEAKAVLDRVVETIGASQKQYDNLLQAIAYAETVRGWYKDDEAKCNTMDEALATARNAYNNTTLTEAEINAAVTALKNTTTSVDKKYYAPGWSMGNVNDPNNAYYIGRTRQSKHWILFWEKGYGENPKNFTCGNHTIDVDQVLRNADRAFEFYADSLKFIRRGNSKTDTYKMVIRLRYNATEWEASGSGVDNLIGLLTLTPWAAPSRNWQTLYHEIGHCFQYQVHCDNGDQNGWMYAPGGGKGCAFWEQCAQWQAYKIMPADQFNNEWFNGYMNNVHKHILHESPRYNNYFVQDYWSYKHGMDFMGRLWNESRNPEDAVETYKRITGITNSEFNDEMYDCAARFATWDIPHLKAYGESKIDSRPQPAMTVMNKYWRIDASVAPENTGHNIIKLNVPSGEAVVSACFEGLNNQSGYRVKNGTLAEWRYGFVAHLRDGSRVYGDMGKSTYSAPKDTIFFTCPADCQRLFFVVSGGPRSYWRQVWDDNDANDEQWPYQVKFGNTNRKGFANLADETGVERVVGGSEIPAVYVSGRTLHIGQPSEDLTIRVLSMSGSCVAEQNCGRSAVSMTLPSGFYLVQLIAVDGRTLATRKVLVR